MGMDSNRVEMGLSLGTNLGDRMACLSEARDRIAKLERMRIVAQSPVYETEPVGVKEKYRALLFLNAVLIVEGCWTVHECFDQLQAIETAMGRQRSLVDQNAPRPMDIDIIYAGAQRIESGGLSIPHPHWMERRFVVQPLADVRPDLILPGAAGTVRDVLAAMPRKERVMLVARDW